MASPTPETIFTRDVLGNYMCNTFSEALNSGPFHFIIVGGATFGLALAKNLFFRSRKIGAGSVAEDGSWVPRHGNADRADRNYRRGPRLARHGRAGSEGPLLPRRCKADWRQCRHRLHRRPAPHLLSRP